MDLCGPLPESNPHRYKYGTIFVDEYTLHYGGYCVLNKSDHELVHKQYCADMASHGGMNISEFHSGGKALLMSDF